jgi:hypothetical protein
VSEVGIRLSANTDVNEQRSVATGKKYELAWFLSVRKFGKEVDIFSVCFSHNIFSERSKFTVVKQISNVSVPCSAVVAQHLFQ